MPKIFRFSQISFWSNPIPTFHFLIPSLFLYTKGILGNFISSLKSRERYWELSQLFYTWKLVWSVTTKCFKIIKNERHHLGVGWTILFKEIQAGCRSGCQKITLYFWSLPCCTQRTSLIRCLEANGRVIASLLWLSRRHLSNEQLLDSFETIPNGSRKIKLRVRFISSSMEESNTDTAKQMHTHVSTMTNYWSRFKGRLRLHPNSVFTLFNPLMPKRDFCPSI